MRLGHAAAKTAFDLAIPKRRVRTCLQAAVKPLTLVLMALAPTSGARAASTSAAVGASAVASRPVGVRGLPKYHGNFIETLPGSLDVSPDGKWIAIWTFKRGNSSAYDLWVSRYQRMNWRWVDSGTGNGSWSPDSSVYAYASGAPYDHPHLIVLSLGTMKKVKSRQQFHFVDLPSWSPDGKSIAVFSGGKWNGGTRYSFDPYSPSYNFMELFSSSGVWRRQYPLTDIGRRSAMSWSPDGTRVAFASINHEGIGPVSTLALHSGIQRPVLIRGERGKAREPSPINLVSIGRAAGRMPWVSNDWLIGTGGVVRSNQEARNVACDASHIVAARYFDQARTLAGVINAYRVNRHTYVLGLATEDSVEVWETVGGNPPTRLRRIIRAPCSNELADIAAGRLWTVKDGVVEAPARLPQ